MKLIAVPAMAIGFALTGLANTASADHVDFFQEGDTLLVLLPPNTSVSSTVNDPDGDTIIGNDRFAQIEFSPGPIAGTNIAARTDIANGQFSYSNDAQTMGTLTLRYGDSATLDLVSGPPYSQLGIDVVALGNAADSFTLNITALDTGSNTDTETILINSAGFYTVDYSAFAGVDFTSIDTLTYEFVSDNLGADITLNSLTRVVPEPTSALALIGLGGLALRRRR